MCSARRNRVWRGFVLALGCLAVTGCGSLPRVTPDMARGSKASPQIESASGVLSAQHSKQILARLQSDNPLGDLLDRHLALEEEIVGSPLVTGNKVLLLKDGPRTYTSMFAAIATARDHINMESYIITDDDVGRRFADALIAKQAAGVQVNLIYDGVGTLDTPREYFTRLREAGINLLEFNPVNPLEAKAGWDVNQRDHRKLMIVDGRIAFLGGINISGVYSGSKFSQPDKRTQGNDLPWRDTDLQIEGPVVAEFQKLFMQTWKSSTGQRSRRASISRPRSPPARTSCARSAARPTNLTA
jgi:cardiolipin synthase